MAVSPATVNWRLVRFFSDYAPRTELPEPFVAKRPTTSTFGMGIHEEYRADLPRVKHHVSSSPS